MSKALLDLPAIRKQVDDLAARIGAPAVAVTYGGFPVGDATPQILVDAQYYFVVSERGTESIGSPRLILTPCSTASSKV